MNSSSLRAYWLCLILGLGSGALGCASKPEVRTPQAGDTPAETAAGQADRSPTAPQPAPPALTPPTPSDLERYTADIEGDGPLHATINTSLGTITCALFEAQAPIAVANFIGLATGQKDWIDPSSGHLRHNVPFYKDTGFHRVIPHFFIQAGDPTGSGSGGPGYTLPDEISDELSHTMPGTLSMANRGEPHSAGSQWFITVAPIPHLDGRHTIFGHCDDLPVIRRIARVPTDPDDRPQEPPEIISIEFSRKPAR